MNKTSKALALTLALLMLTALLTACGGGGGIPSGTYKPASALFESMGSIEISGNSITMNIAGTSAVTASYKLEGGKVMITEDGQSVDSTIEYKDGSLWLGGADGGVEFKK
ncbi:MAG: hypothetical protein LBR85_09600 [Oscillospiraceae bacterium]|nr:hypothetical protein [Oscillospiraceae bacterium]